jgi:hypothetical protein
MRIRHAHQELAELHMIPCSKAAAKAEGGLQRCLDFGVHRMALQQRGAQNTVSSLLVARHEGFAKGFFRQRHSGILKADGDERRLGAADR